MEWGGDNWATTLDALAPPAPAREYRGLWVASVSNIDWPSRPGLSPEELRAEIRRIVDLASDLKLNALFVQVRPSCDALYRSELEPFSFYLTGAQGDTTRWENEPGFDPLVEWITRAREKGIELHAWINPFRARPKGAGTPMAASHIAVRRPDLVREYDGMLWLDPGEPDAADHSLRVLEDLVKRYDLDGLHFDDYFYPYPKDGQPFPDDASYAKYTAAGGTLERERWRRASIDGFVQRVYDQTKRLRPHTRVSISPFGIWRPGHPAGVAGFDAYAGLSADSRRWVCEGWLDMVIPQLYWKIEAKKQPYAELLDWWLKQNERGRLVVAGNYASRINDTPESWQPMEIVNQIERTRRQGGSGNVHFSAVALLQNRKQLADALRQGVYAEPALAPETPWLAGSSSRPSRPRVSAETDASQVTLRWSDVDPGLIRQIVLATRRDGRWETTTLGPQETQADVPLRTSRGELSRLAVALVDRTGAMSRPVIVRVRKPDEQLASH